MPQSSTRTFTSKFKAGTLPLQSYLISDADDIDENLEDVGVETELSDETEVDENFEQFVDEPPEWESDSSDDADTMDEYEVQEEVPTVAGFCHLNQNLVTRSGRRVLAARHFMFDQGLSNCYTLKNKQNFPLQMEQIQSSLLV